MKRPRKLDRPTKGKSEKTEIIKIIEDTTTNILEVKRIKREEISHRVRENICKIYKRLKPRHTHTIPYKLIF